jgi:hypothetical protein
MTGTTRGNGPTTGPGVRRGTALLALLAVAGAHLAPLRDWHGRAGYLDAGMVAVAAAALGSAGALGARASRADWRRAGAVAAAAAAAYLASREPGVPGATGVVGDWVSPAGTAALAADLLTLALAAAALRRPGQERTAS